MICTCFLEVVLDAKASISASISIRTCSKNGAFGDDHHLPPGEMNEPERKRRDEDAPRSPRIQNAAGTINDSRV
jgi:hypothetical protein